MSKQEEGFRGINGDVLTPAEVKAIQGLARLAKRWPSTLKLVSMGGACTSCTTLMNGSMT